MPLRESENTIFVVEIINLDISTRADGGHCCSLLLVLCRSFVVPEMVQGGVEKRGICSGTIAIAHS